MERQKSRKKWFNAGRQLAAFGLCSCLLFTGCRAEKVAGQGNDSVGTTAQEDTESAAPGVLTRESQPEIDVEQAAREAFVPSGKDEMVSVQAEADGTPKKIEVSGTLSGFRQEDGAYVQDISGLTELKNATGEEDFAAAEDGTVYWQNLGSDIHYEGISDAELPVDVRVTYYLDGEELPLSEMKGKSGSVKIRFDYDVHETTPVMVRGTTQEMMLPFLALSMVILPEDTFSDVEVSSGQILMLGGQKAAVGYALPGLAEDLNLAAHEDTADIEIPSSVEITAETEEFDLDFTATVLKPGLFRDMDEEKLDSMEEETGDVDEMEDAVKEMEDAAQKLVDGTTELQEAIQQYTDGVSEVTGAIDTINQSLAAVDLSSLGQLGESLQQIAALPQLGEFPQQSTAIMEAAAQLTQLQSSLQELQNGVSQLAQGAAALPDAGQALYDGTAGLKDGVTEFRDGIREFREEGVQELTSFFHEDLGDLIGRLRGVHMTDLQYAGYTPSLAGQEVNVSFLIETDGTK